MEEVLFLGKRKMEVVGLEKMFLKYYFEINK